jgi:hypothetical protein
LTELLSTIVRLALTLLSLHEPTPLLSTLTPSLPHSLALTPPPVCHPQRLSPHSLTTSLTTSLPPPPLLAPSPRLEEEGAGPHAAGPAAAWADATFSHFFFCADLPSSPRIPAAVSLTRSLTHSLTRSLAPRLNCQVKLTATTSPRAPLLLPPHSPLPLLHCPTRSGGTEALRH